MTAGMASIYDAAGCDPAKGGNCIYSLVSDIWNGTAYDGGGAFCNNNKGRPGEGHACKYSIRNVVFRGRNGNPVVWGPAADSGKCKDNLEK